MEERWPLLLLLTVLGRVCIAAARDQEPLGSSWATDNWDVISREGRHYGSLLPLARPRQRLDSDEPELLYAVWDSPPHLLKEGISSEEAIWVPDAEPLETIKERYAFGSREFDHKFGLIPGSEVIYAGPSITATSPVYNDDPTPLTDVYTPQQDDPTPLTDVYTPLQDDPTPLTDTPTPPTEPPTPDPHATTPFPHASLMTRLSKYGFLSHRVPRKYYLTGEVKQSDPPRSNLFRKYYIAPTSGGAAEEASPSPQHSSMAQFFPGVHPPLSYPNLPQPRPPPTVRQYFLQPPAAQEMPHTTNLTSFDVYEKLRRTRTVDMETRSWVSSNVPKSRAWVSFSSGMVGAL